MTQPFNEHGDGITHYPDVVKNDDGTQWFNGFDVTSIYDHENRTRYVYPAETLLNFFTAVRQGGIVVRHAETDEVIGKVTKFNRDLRGEHPNVIRLGIAFTTDLGTFEHAVIRPALTGTSTGLFDQDNAYLVTEVTEVTAVAIVVGNDIPTLGVRV